MSLVDVRAHDVARAAGFDAAWLDVFLRDAVSGLKGPMRLSRIGGGQSNPTFFVDYDSRALVLRKQPPGDLLPSAHAVDREYRVMRALGETGVPVPRTVLYHADRGVVGTPFFLMDKVDGRVFASHALPGLAPAQRRAMYASMARTLAAIHRVDPAAVGLGDYGRPGNYFARQIARWSKQWEASRTRDNPALDRLIAWLPDHVPEGDETTICHGDYRIGNLMFHPTEPRVVAVLDWELSTLGHPLADLGFNAMAWETRPDEYGGLRGLDLEALGIPPLDAYVGTYLDAAGRRDGIAPFHVAFALFRFAVIFEGIAARAVAGNASSDDAAQAGTLGPAFARRAVELVGA